MITQAVYDRAQKILTAAQENSDRLTEFESDFVDSMTDRMEKYELRTIISPAQADVLKKLAEKLEV